MTEGSSPQTQRSRGKTTGRGTPVTASEPAELLVGLLQGLLLGCLKGATSLMGWGDTPSWVNGRHSPSTPHQSHYRLRENCCLQEHGTHYGKLERTFLELFKTYCGMFRGRTRDRGRERLSWAGENKCGKIQKKGDKRSWTYVNRVLVSMLVLKCSKGQGLCQPGLHPWGGSWFCCAQGHK